MSHIPIYQTSSRVAPRRPKSWRLLGFGLALLTCLLCGLLLGRGTETTRPNTNVMPIVVARQLPIDKVSNGLAVQSGTPPDAVSTHSNMTKQDGQDLGKQLGKLLSELDATLFTKQSLSNFNAEL